MRINEQIRIPQVRLFDDTTDEALGIVTIEDARQLAVDRGLDLVEVAPLAQPPVCRLMDYGRFKFEALKREKDSRRDHNVVQLKEQKLRPKISDHDFRTKLAKVKQFLGEGDKVKLTIMFRGREMVHQEFGRKLLDRMTEELNDLAVIERSPLVEGRNMIMILSPTAKKHARSEHGHEERRHGEEAAPSRNGAEPRTAASAASAVSATPSAPEAAPPVSEPAVDPVHAKAAAETTPAAPADEAPAATPLRKAASKPAASSTAKSASTPAARKPAAARRPAATATTASTTTRKPATRRGASAEDSNS